MFPLGKSSPAGDKAACDLGFVRDVTSYIIIIPRIFSTFVYPRLKHCRIKCFTRNNI